MTERQPFPGRPNNLGSSTGGTGPSGAADQGRQKAEDLASQAQEKVGEAAEQAKQQATSRLAGQKTAAADSLGSMAEAVRRTSSQLHQQDQGMMADYADSAADQLERLSAYLRETDVEGMVYEVERYARRQPAVFMGGAMLLGFLGARFLKSGSGRREMEHGYYPGSGRGANLPTRYPSPYGAGYRPASGQGSYGSSPSRPTGGDVGSTGRSTMPGETSPRTMGEVPGGLTPGMGTGFGSPATPRPAPGSGTLGTGTPGTPSGGMTPGTFEPSTKPPQRGPDQGGTPSSGGSGGR